MATQVQFRRGSTAQVAAATPAAGEIVVNTDKDTVVVGDGSTAGGFELARADLNNVSDTSLNAALTGNTVSALTITTLTGTSATFTTADNSDNLTLVSTDADALFGPNLNFYRNSASPADNDLLAQIDFNGRNDNSQDVLYANIQTQIIDASDGSEDGRFQINTIVAGTDRNRFLLTPTETVFNDNSIDLDFRVESNDNTHALFVEGSSGNVGIGTSSIASGGSNTQNFQIHNSTANSTYLKLSTSGTGATASDGLDLIVDNSGNAYFWNRENADLLLGTNNQTRVRIDSSGNLGVGQSPVGFLTNGYILRLNGGTQTYLAFNNNTHTTQAVGGFVIGNDASAAYITQRENQPIIVATNDEDRLRITQGGQVLIGGITSGSYTHDKGLRVRTNEVGSHALDAALSLEGSGGDFYAINMTGPSNTGFGILTVFSSSTDYLNYEYRDSSGSTGIIQLLANGNVVVHGALSKGSGSFRIDHPLPAKTNTHHLVHSFIEGPQADLIYRGKVTLVGGSSVVNVDTAAGMTEGTFEALCADVQCFTSNESGWTAVKGSVSGNTLTITAQDNTCTDTISWMVVGERKDQHMIDTDWTDDNGKVIVEPLKDNE
jgi:hypothetical protein